MNANPLGNICPTCAAAPGEVCSTVVGLHWERARRAGMTLIDCLSWRAPALPALGAATADLRLAVAALATACDLAEVHRAPAEQVARLRDIGRRLTASNGAPRVS